MLFGHGQHRTNRASGGFSVSNATPHPSFSDHPQTDTYPHESKACAPPPALLTFAQLLLNILTALAH
jgi:hypothetical protein